jgi:hypothetical protein
MERRAPVLARHEIYVDAPDECVAQVEAALHGVPDAIRRKVVALVCALEEQWAQESWALDGHSMIVDIEELADRMRVEAFSHANVPSGYWRNVGLAAASEIADGWGVEQRDRAGVWFEVSSRDAAGLSG